IRKRSPKPEITAGEDRAGPALASRAQSIDNQVGTKAPCVLGTTIGNYKVTAQLGEGGMGIVYLAEHPAIGRKAAIKVLHPKLAADPEVVSRFFHEARASNAIRHPNIVEAYDYGTRPDGAPYIIMEYLEGESLSARLKRLGRLPPPTTRPSSTATSSPTTCSSPPIRACRAPSRSRFSISASRSWRRPSRT